MGSDTVAPDPFRQFEAEHEEALRALHRLEVAADGLERCERPALCLEAVRQVHVFLTTAVREHNSNEQRALFGLLGEEAPVALFEQEHRTVRRLEEELGQALNGPSPDTSAPAVARPMIDVLRAHIERENQVLFPMARTLLGPDGIAMVARRLAIR